MDLEMVPDKTCRVCLSGAAQLKSICATTEDENQCILDSLHFVVNIKIAVEDMLPNQICNNCETALHSAEAFKLRCLNSEMILTERFDSGNKNEIIEELSKKPVKREHLACTYNNNNTSKRKLLTEIIPIVSIPESDCNYLEDNLSEPLVLTTKVKIEPNSETGEFNEAPFDSVTFICKKETIYLPQTDIDDKLVEKNSIRGRNKTNKRGKRAASSKKKVCDKVEHLSSKNNLNSEDIKQIIDSENELNSHIPVQNEAAESESDIATPKNICPTCKREFKLATQLRNHIIKVHVRGNRKDLDYECEVCKAAFPQLWLLNKHMRFHSEDAFTHICPECGKKLRNKYYLEEHVMRHNGVKPFQCDQCDNSFVTKMELIMHKRRHNGEMPFSCEHCGRKFRAYSSLVRHRRTHTGERPYKCDMCPKSFAESGTRNEHRRIHTGEKPFQCKYCEQKFTKRHHLKTHLSQHGEPSRKQNK